MFFEFFYRMEWLRISNTYSSIHTTIVGTKKIIHVLWRRTASIVPGPFAPNLKISCNIAIDMG